MAANVAGNSTLPPITGSGHLVRPSGRVQGNGLLPPMQGTGYVRAKAVILNLTGQIRADGSAIFCFVGPANLAVTWSITVGAGALFPDLDFTDQFGRASCRYEAGGYVGLLTISVAYGS